MDELIQTILAHPEMWDYVRGLVREMLAEQEAQR